MFTLYNVYYGLAVLDLERAGLYALHSETAVKAGWQSLLERGLLPLVMSAVHSLEVVVHDFHIFEQFSREDAGDFLAGQLTEAGTFNIVVALLHLINHAAVQENLTQRLEQSVKKWMAHRFRHSAELDRLLRIEVDRLVQIIKDCGMPALHYLDVRDNVRRDLDLSEVDLIAIAIQACAEAGYEAVGDKWIREITVQLSNIGRGVVLTPTPTPRGIMVGIIGRMFMVQGTSIHGLITGDRWYAESDIEYCTDAHSRLSLLTAFHCSESHMIRQPVFKGSIREVPRWMTKLLTELVRGEHDIAIKTYAGMMRLKNSTVSPYGRESALMYEQFLERMKEEVGSTRSALIGKVISMRSLVRLAVIAENVMEYNQLIAGRIIGSFEVSKLSIRGRSWQMILDTNDVGCVNSDISGTDIPSDLVDFILKTINDTQPQENPEAVPSGGSMVYMWPITRELKSAHVSWRTEP
ncbi:unnamed protein product [Agarophyton chilense]